MTSRLLISTLAALPLLAACSSSGPSGIGGGTTTSSSSSSSTSSSSTSSSSTGSSSSSGMAVDGCGGHPQYLVAGDVCVDGITPGCVSDGVESFPCTADADCAGPSQLIGISTVCRKCDATHGYCTPPCTAGAACPGGTCDATGHCVLASCTADADCAVNFTCSSADAMCVRKTCTADAECSGYCVAGHCTDKPASCADCT